MNKEECMLALEQMILELPQYRKITNELCNRFIPMYVRNNYEQEQIYIEGNHSSSKNYCWDIYDTIPIEIIESILDNFKEQDDIEQENQQLKEQLKQRDEVIDEAINKIEYLRMEKWSIQGTDIMDVLDILTKYKGDNNEQRN